LSEYDVWEYNNIAEKYVLVSLDENGYGRLQAQGWRLIVDEAASAMVRYGRSPATFYDGYRTVDELYTDLAALNAAYPTLTEVVDYGDSYCQALGGCTTLGGEMQPGYDLLAIRVSNEAISGTSTISGTTIISGTKPLFFLMANIHAREITTPELAMRMLDWLIGGYGVDAEATWLVDWHEIWIVPTANPDGHWLVELGEAPPYGGPFFQRKNADQDADEDGSDDCPIWPPLSFIQYGVDLNRNHSFQWDAPGGASASPCSQTYRGPVPSSEPEVAQLQALIQKLIPDQRGPDPADAAPDTTAGILITLHSYSELVLWPWGYTTAAAPNKSGLQAIGDKLATYNSYTSCQPSLCLYTASGTSDDWAYGELGIPAFTFEVGQEFMPPYSQVDAIQWPANGPAFQYAAKIAGRPYFTVQGPDALDITTTPAGSSAITLTAVIDDSQNGNQPITGAAYTLDRPYWSTGIVSHTLMAADGLFDSPVETVTAVVATDSLNAGRRLLFVRGQDADGRWGPLSAVFLGEQPYRFYLPVIGL
jgi:hypothetical protein